MCVEVKKRAFSRFIKVDDFGLYDQIEWKLGSLVIWKVILTLTYPGLARNPFPLISIFP